MTSPNPLLRSSKAPKILKLDYMDLRQITEDFTDLNMIGIGGFAKVYKGKLVNGTDVAVKVLLLEAVADFIAELQVLARAKHKNLVRILGFCNQPKAIILQLMPNGTLEQYLHGSDAQLNWPTSLQILKGVAQAICYLHHENPDTIVHCDLKPSKILLDEDMEAHVSDFGISRIFITDVTHSTSGIRGSIGYMAPEYAYMGRISTKVDVYSFGIVVLEALTRTRPTDERFSSGTTLVHWVDNDPLGCIDVQSGSNDTDQMQHILGMAKRCCNNDPPQRPNMKQVLAYLNHDVANNHLCHLRSIETLLEEN